MHCAQTIYCHCQTCRKDDFSPPWPLELFVLFPQLSDHLETEALPILMTHDDAETFPTTNRGNFDFSLPHIFQHPLYSQHPLPGSVEVSSVSVHSSSICVVVMFCCML